MAQWKESPLTTPRGRGPGGGISLPDFPMAPFLELLLFPLPLPAPDVLLNSTSGTSFRLPSPFLHSCLQLSHVLLPHHQASQVAFRAVFTAPGLGFPRPADLALNVRISHSGHPHFHPIFVPSVILPHASWPPNSCPHGSALQVHSPLLFLPS